MIIHVTDCNGLIHACELYDWKTLPIREELTGVKIVGSKDKVYYNIPCAFDIETTSVGKNDKPKAWMYIWQFCIGQSVCIGRTWDEFKCLLNRLESYTLGATKFLIWVHNLSFEFQFMKQFIDITHVFARDKRAPISVRCKGYEFRCSYYLSNMSLAKLCKNSEGCTYWKKDGDAYDYRKIRYPWTVMSESELEYCYCDVRGLCQAIESRLVEDTLATIPLTSTGYVRRDFRDICTADPKIRNLMKQIQLDRHTYDLCKQAIRGGDTGANYNYAGRIVSDVKSKDIKSSYPASMLFDKYPMSRFVRINVTDLAKFRKCVDTKACLFVFVAKDIHVKSTDYHPYIDKAHCRKLSGGKYDNGRVLSAKMLEMTVTDVDWRIIEEEYNFTGLVISEMYIAHYDYLPMTFRKHLLEMFHEKCKLEYKVKTLSDDNCKYLYDKYKNKINSAYGMMVTDICSPEIAYEDGVWVAHEVDVDSSLAKYYKSRNSFLSYQHGVWVTANARKRLRDMKHIIGRDDIYDDTDSIKYIGDHEAEFARVNEYIMSLYDKCGLPIQYKYEDQTYNIGTWDDDGCYDKFVTLGAKKYCYEINGKATITVAGCNKQKGSAYLNSIGGISKFTIGRFFDENASGRTTSWYNDDPVHTITVGDKSFTTGSNIAVFNTTYKLGITDEYLELISDNDLPDF